MLIENKTGFNAMTIIEKIDRDANIFAGYDVKNERICDVVDEGIVDSF
jgi:hypothetical protein